MYRNERFAIRRLLLALVDAMLAFAIALYIFRDSGGELRLLGPGWTAFATSLPMAFSGAYVSPLRKPFSHHQFCTLLAAMCAGATFVLLSHVHAETMPVALVVRATLSLFAVLLVSRVALLVTHRLFLRRRRVWVLAEEESVAQELAQKVRRCGRQYELFGWSAKVEEDELALRLQECEAVLCTSEMRSLAESVCRRLGKELLLAPAAADVLLFASGSQQLDDLLLLQLPKLELSLAQRAAKRVLDVAASSFLLAICGIPMVLVALLIWLGSGAPILFRQERRGLRGHGFKVLKFRTMIQHAEQRTGPVLATREDPRVTPLGRALRATRLDELPQLWNVLRGEMSLVGPRPEREFFARRFDLEFPEYPLRTSVKPGLTGLAQVCGGYSSSAESKLRLDLMYIANYSLSLDLSILLQTIRVVLQRSPALGVEPASPVNFGYEASMRREGQHGA